VNAGRPGVRGAATSERSVDGVEPGGKCQSDDP